MHVNTIELDQPAGPNASRAPLGGRGSISGKGDGNGDGHFQGSYARVIGVSVAPLARGLSPVRTQSNLDPVNAAAVVHSVRAGDTLYAIVRARLVAMGANADAKASMQGVKQLAQANKIHNPDRIYIGQEIDISALQSSVDQSTTLTADRIDRSATATPALEQHSSSHWQEHVTDTGSQTVAEAPAASQSTINMFPSAIARDVGTAVVDAGVPVPLAIRQVARYEEDVSTAPVKLADRVPDIVYKGVIGKVLDAMPLEPATRTGLQQANAVVSSTVSAHALGVLTGFGGPVLAVAGLIWGIFSARQIHAAATVDSRTIGAPSQADALPRASAAIQIAQNKAIDAHN